MFSLENTHMTQREAYGEHWGVQPDNEVGSVEAGTHFCWRDSLDRTLCQ